MTRSQLLRAAWSVYRHRSPQPAAVNTALFALCLREAWAYQHKPPLAFTARENAHAARLAASPDYLATIQPSRLD